jgi:Carboxypeptidase regulatory-like domain/TonB-dependent Receptor Plug Domain/TonB dependent receptor
MVHLLRCAKDLRSTIMKNPIIRVFPVEGRAESQPLSHKPWFHWLAALLLLFVGLVPLALGQGAGTGDISGTVTDQHGAAIPEATVIVRNAGTGIERALSTNEQGFYAAPLLQPGTYDIRFTKQGFAPVLRQGAQLAVGQALALDVQLSVQAAQESVTVTSEVGLVETGKLDFSNLVTQTQVENLPLNGRRWDNLVLLTPGVSEDGGFGGVSFRGISSLYNNNQVDGADNNQAFFSEARGRTRLPYGYSLDAIKEFNVSTAGYSAEYGRAAGGVVNAVTKSGTNEFHGDGFYFVRDKALLAEDPIAKQRVQPKPDERRQQFGGSFGGPLIHDKLFFFANYDQQKHNFPAIISPFSPASYATEVANCSDPNCPAVISALNALTNTTNPRNGDNYIGLGKIDYQLNGNNRISGVFNILRWNSPNGIFTSPVLTTTSLGNGTDQVQNEFATVTWNSILRQTLVNEVRFQYGRDFESQIPNASGPSIGITGAASFGMPNFLPRGAFPNEKRYQWTDNLGWLRGRHELKLGGDLNFVQDHIQNLFQGGGVYSYFVDTGTNSALNKFATDLRTGSKQYSSFTQAVDPITGSGVGDFSTWDYNFYLQDNFKLRPNFTLNLGVRYELQTMPAIVKANPAVPETASLNTDTNNLGPRLGFSWGIGKEQKMVLRGGYGIYYGRTQNSTIFAALFQNGVFQQTFRFTPTGPTSCGAPAVPNVVFPQPTTAPPFSAIFGSSGSTPSSKFSSLAAFQAACPNSAGGSVVDALDPNFVNPLVHEYDLSVERELVGKLSLQVSFVGSRGLRLPVFVDANLPAPDTTRTYLVQNSTGAVTSQFAVPFFSGAVPRPRAGVGVLLEGKSVVNSWYNGLVVTVRRRMSHGFSFDANFTWSQARDTGEVAGVNGTFAGTTRPLNPLDIRAEAGLSEIDIRRRFIVNTYWETPFATWTQSDALKHVVGGWKISSIWRLQDGRPVEADMGGRPGCNTGDGGLTCGAVDGNGLAVNGRAPFIGRNSQFLSPGFFDTDVRLAREFKTTERTRLEVMWEAFNAFNHKNAVPSSGIFAVDNLAYDFNAPGKFGCPATGPAGFNGCVAPRTSSFLTVTSTSNTLYTARQMQLGLKFSF